MGLFSCLLHCLIELAALVCELVKNALQFLALCTKRHAALTAENLFLRKQLAYYQERKISPRRFNNAARYLMVLLSCWFDWKEALVVVTPKTLIGCTVLGFGWFGGGNVVVGDPGSPQSFAR